MVEPIIGAELLEAWSSLGFVVCVVRGIILNQN
jgi:hypothetical protein